MTYSKRCAAVIVTVFILAGFVMGIMPAAVSAATLTSGKTGTSTVSYLGNSKDGRGWNNPHHTGVKQYKYTVKINGSTLTGYCMEPGKGFSSNNKYTSKLPSATKAWTKLPASRQRVLALVLYYGYNKGKNAPYGSGSDYYAATQVLVWEAADGDITLSQTGKWGKTSNKHDNLISGRTYAEKNYKWIKEKITEHVKGADFTSYTYDSAKTYVMKYNYTTKKWSVALKDSGKGNYLKRHTDTASGVAMSRSGYSYTFTTDAVGTQKAVLVNDKSAGTSQAMLVLAAAKESQQSVILGATDDTKFYLKLRTEKPGTGKIIKTSDDGKVAGFKFQITCSENGYSAMHTTDSAGNIELDLFPGEYTVKECLTDDQKKEGYIEAAAKKITITENGTATLKIHNKKITKESSLIIKKVNDDGSSPEGFEFEIMNEETGTIVKCVTDEDGAAVLEKMKKGKYTVSEILSEEQLLKFERPESQRVEVREDGQVITVQFNNKTKSTPVVLKKKCIDGRVSGIEFKISGKLLSGEAFGPRNVITGDDGTISLGELKPGTYMAEEMIPDNGTYLPQEPLEFKVTGDEEEPITIEYENVPTSLYITKVDGITGEFLDGAEFRLMESENRSILEFSVVREKERVTLNLSSVSPELFSYDDPEKTDFGCLKGLVTGETYTLKEVKAPEGYLPAEDISFVFEEGMELTIENEKPAVVPEEPSEPAPVTETEPETEVITEKAVETGDSGNLVLPAAVLLIAAAVTGVLFIRRENEE